MGLPALVLVHGAQHAGDCWSPTIAKIHDVEPELKVLAIDLPGRRGKSGDLITACIDEWVDSVVSDIDDAGLDDLVIVGHSMAGMTVPGVITKLGSARVREMILAAAYVPPDGAALVNTLPGALGVVRTAHSKAVCPEGCARHLAYRMGDFSVLQRDDEGAAQVLCRTVLSGVASVVLENVDRSAMPDEVPRTWVLTKQDRALPVKLQRKCMDAIGGSQTVIPIDTCHNLMISAPERLAEILVERCRLYT